MDRVRPSKCVCRGGEAGNSGRFVESNVAGNPAATESVLKPNLKRHEDQLAKLVVFALVLGVIVVSCSFRGGTRHALNSSPP